MKGILGYTSEKIGNLDINQMIDADTSQFSLEKTKAILKIQIAAFAAFSGMATIGMRLPLESKLQDKTLIDKALNFGIEYNLAIPTAIVLGSVVVESAMYHHRASSRIHELDSGTHPAQ